ncbi:MAG: LptF/LptG family permease [Gammaproteobacteria bacterium]
MPILARYFFRRVGAAIALLWLGLTALVATLQLIAEADRHDFAAAALLALLQTPRLAMETLPFACAIAAAAALQRMEENRELRTMRAAGLSPARAALFAGGGGIIFAAALLAVGELLLEPSESLARAVKNAPAAKGEVWLHHEGAFFYAAQIAPGGNMRGVAVYVPQKNAMRIVAAATARQRGDKWRLTDGEETTLSEDGVRAESFAAREWDFPPPAAALLAVLRRPREMSARALADASQELREGGARFSVALWRRLAGIAAVPLLAACAVWSVGLRRRVTTAVLSATGLVGAYYFAAIIFAQIALLLQTPSLAAAPLLLPAAALAVAVKRRFI